jgi:hypothetical protein
MRQKAANRDEAKRFGSQDLLRIVSGCCGRRKVVTACMDDYEKDSAEGSWPVRGCTRRSIGAKALAAGS